MFAAGPDLAQVFRPVKTIHATFRLSDVRNFRRPSVSVADYPSFQRFCIAFPGDDEYQVEEPAETGSACSQPDCLLFTDGGFQNLVVVA